MLVAPLVHRHRLRLLGAFVLAPLLLVPLPSCGTKAVGVDACRRIETARCEAASACDIVEDVQECIRFADVNCLHGVALEEAPGNVAVTRCVEALERAGSCAEGKGGKKEEPAECSSTFNGSHAATVCELIEEPSRAPQCAFLVPDTEDKAEAEEDAPEKESQLDAGAADSGQ